MANKVEIVISVDNTQGLTALTSTMGVLKQLGVEGDVSMRKVGAATELTNAQLRATGTDAAAAAAGFNVVGKAAEDNARRVSSAGAEIQQMMLNIQAAQAKSLSYQSSTRLGPATQLGESFANLGTAAGEVDNLGEAFVRMGRKAEPAEEGIRKLGAHAASSLDGVRLLSQEFGIRLPRALESMLSRIPAVTAAISGLIGTFALIAFAEVFYRMGEAAYNLYEKYISLNAAAEQYHKTVEQHRDEEFVNPQSIEDTTDRINRATAAAKGFKAAGEEIHNSAWKDIFSGDLQRFAMGVGSLVQGRDLSNQGYKSQGQSDVLSAKQIDNQHKLNDLAIEQEHAGDAALRGRQKINAELEKQIELSKEERRYGQQRDSAAQGYGLRHGGETEDNARQSIARQKAAADIAIQDRETRDRTIQLQNEATNAGLQGNALLLAQKLEAEATIRRSATGTQAEIAAVELKYHNESMHRIREETDAINKRADIERDAGLTGLSKVQADGQRRIGDIDDREKKGLYSDQTAPNTSSALATKDRATATAQMYREMGEAEKQYRQDVATEDERSNADQLTGFAKITAEVAAETQRRADAFEKMYGQMDQSDVRYLAGRKALEDSESLVAANGDRQRAQLEQQISQQTLQMNAEAAQAERRVRGTGISGWVQDYHAGIEEIQAAETAMLAKIAAEDSKPGVTNAAHDQYQQQKVDAERKADAQIEQLNQQMAHQVAGVLQGMFDDPIHYIQNRMKQMMFEILANWIMQSAAFKSSFGGMMNGLHLGGGSTGGGAVGGMIGGGSTTAHDMGMSTAIANAAGASSAAPGFSGGARTTTEGSGSFGSAGTVAQAMVSPGFSGTASTPSAVGAAINIPQSMAAVPAAATTASDAGWNDGTIGSEQDASSVASTGMTVAQAQAQGGAGTSQSMPNAIGGIIGAGVGAYTGTKGIIGAFEGGKASDILSGGESGAAMGASIGMLAGPLGAAIGGIAGGIGGATAGLVGWASGEGNRLGAQKYFRDTMRPQMEAVEASYAKGSGDAMSAISQVDSMAASGFTYMGTKFGYSAAQWAKTAYIDKERTTLEEQINSMALGGRDYMSASAAQFHSGGPISGFGDFATSPNEGFIHAMLDETVMNPSASSAHGSTLAAMNAGASPAEIAAQYLKSTGSSGAPTAQSGGDTHHHWNVDAIDASSFHKFLTRGGGMAAINKAGDKYVNQYAGDAA